VRIQAGYVNLATISEAELREDGTITLHWNSHSKRYAGADAVMLRHGLDMLAGCSTASSDSGVVPASEEEEELDPAWDSVPHEETVSPPVLKLHAAQTPSQHAREFETAGAGLAEAKARPGSTEAADDDELSKPESALSRRAQLVMGFEPIASLSHKQQGVFLAAIEKAADFNHLSPKHRRLLQDAEARRREELRQ